MKIGLYFSERFLRPFCSGRMSHSQQEGRGLQEVRRRRGERGRRRDPTQSDKRVEKVAGTGQLELER